MIPIPKVNLLPEIDHNNLDVMSAEIKILLLFIFLTAIDPAISQVVYKTTTAKVGFFSSAPVEDIKASSREGISVFIPETGDISFRVNIKSLRFRKALMQDHFNEEFMESDRYPTASFHGKIIRPTNLPSEGEVAILLSGILEIHGVRQKREIPAVIHIGNDNILLKSNFEVACKDHNIKIPKILWKNIAEVLEVDVTANYKR